MAKLNCRCGATLTLSGEIPNPIEWKLLSDELFDEFSGNVDVELIYQAATSLFRCENCGRLWVFWDGFDAAPMEYYPGQSQ
jgi:hypothetical protein